MPFKIWLWVETDINKGDWKEIATVTGNWANWIVTQIINANPKLNQRVAYGTEKPAHPLILG